MPDPVPDERRLVRADVPTLSTEANDRLTDELRSVIGSEAVEVPADRPDVAGRPRRRRSRVVADVLDARLGAVFTALATACVAGVVGLALGTTAALLVALAVLALATALAVAEVYRLVAEEEHPDPDTAALLEEEGVGDSDRLLQDLVDEFRPPGR